MVDLSKTSIDFDDLVIELESDLQTRDTFKALFPGETSKVFTEHGAGITALMLYHINVATQNAFMPTAFSKSAVYALASSLGAPPTRKLGAQVDILVTVNTALASAITLPKFSRFSGRGLEWYTLEDIIVPAGASGQTYPLTLRQGQRLVENFVSNGKNFQRLEIGEDFSVDDQQLVVSVNAVDWTSKGATLLTADLGEEAYAEQTTPDGTVFILFGNQLFGTVPTIGSTIDINYAVTEGVDSNSSITGDTFNYLDLFNLGGGIFLSQQGIAITTASGGSDEESIDVVKNTAPRIYAANKRAVRRNDYEALVQQFTGAAAVKAFGEFEEAVIRGFQSNTMMNRAYISVVPQILTIQNNNIATGNGATTVFAPTFPDPDLMPGSILINSNTDIFDDRDGRGILTSPTVSFNLLAGGSATATDNNGDAGLAFDGNPLTLWDAGVAAAFNNIIRISYDMGLGNEKEWKSVRLLAAGGVNCTVNERSFPSLIRVLASNVATPDLSTDDDWDVIRGFVILNDPGTGQFSRWIPLDNPINEFNLVTPTAIAYRHLAIDISDRHGNANSTKIALIEAQDTTDTSVIDYETGVSTIKYLNAPNGPIDAKYAISNLTSSQKQGVIDFLKGTATTDALNHFTTLVIYRNAVALKVSITASIFHSKGFDPATVLAAVQSSIEDLFDTDVNSLGREIYIGDIYQAMQEVSGVDYAILVSPTNDIILSLNEFPLLIENNISIFASERG